MNELYYDSRMLLIYLAVKYKGDYEQMLNAIMLKDINVPYEEALKVYQSLSCKVMTYLDYDYPARLKQIQRPPLVLFYYGDISLLDKKSIAVVGSRDFSNYGKHVTERVIADIIKGKVVVSGLAKGIDAIAHQAAINNDGRTIAILGSGIDYCYPSENKELYEEIKKNHLLMSEYPFDTSPERINFPMRNRIVVALGDAMFIPQINTYMSGTMISINLGLNLGKEVFVAPHPLGSEAINNKMLNEGATLIESKEQMLRDLGWSES